MQLSSLDLIILSINLNVSSFQLRLLGPNHHLLVLHHRHNHQPSTAFISCQCCCQAGAQRRRFPVRLHYISRKERVETAATSLIVPMCCVFANKRTALQYQTRLGADKRRTDRILQFKRVGTQISRSGTGQSHSYADESR